MSNEHGCGCGCGCRRRCSSCACSAAGPRGLSPASWAEMCQAEETASGAAGDLPCCPSVAAVSASTALNPPLSGRFAFATDVAADGELAALSRQTPAGRSQ